MLFRYEEACSICGWRFLELQGKCRVRQVLSDKHSSCSVRVPTHRDAEVPGSRTVVRLLCQKEPARRLCLYPAVFVLARYVALWQSSSAAESALHTLLQSSPTDTPVEYNATTIIDG